MGHFVYTYINKIHNKRLKCDVTVSPFRLGAVNDLRAPLESHLFMYYNKNIKKMTINMIESNSKMTMRYFCQNKNKPPEIPDMMCVLFSI